MAQEEYSEWYGVSRDISKRDCCDRSSSSHHDSIGWIIYGQFRGHAASDGDLVAEWGFLVEVCGARQCFTENFKMLQDDKETQSLQLDHIKRRQLVLRINWYPCGVSLEAVRQALATWWAENSLIFLFRWFLGMDFFRQFGEKLVPMVDYRCCSLLSPHSYDMRRSIDEMFRGFPAILDGLAPT